MCFHKLYDIRGGKKLKPVRRSAIIGILIQKIRDTNPKKNLIQTHIAGSTVPIEDIVHAIFINPYVSSRRVMLRMIQTSITGGDVLLLQDISKVFSLYHLGVTIVYMGGCTILTDKDLHIITLWLYVYIMYTHPNMDIFTQNNPPYLWWRK